MTHTASDDLRLRDIQNQALVYFRQIDNCRPTPSKIIELITSFQAIININSEQIETLLEASSKAENPTKLKEAAENLRNANHALRIAIAVAAKRLAVVAVDELPFLTLTYVQQLGLYPTEDR